MECWVHRDDAWEEMAAERLAESLADPNAFAWLELTGTEHPLLEQLGRALDLHELALEDALSARQRPKLEEYPHGGLFLVMPTALEWNDRVEYGETHAFLGRQYLIVVRHGLGPGYGGVLDRLKQGRFPPGAASALYVLLDRIVDDYRPVTDHLVERYDVYESTLLETRKAHANLSRIYDLKRQTQHLAQTLDPMTDVVHELIHLHPDMVDKTMKTYYRDVLDHLMRLNRTLGQLREALSDGMHVSLATLSLRQNESVQKLAGWGAILAIPTLVFSLYGMNFRFMPELGTAWGYPVTLLATAAACYGLYRRLKRRGWI